MCLEYYNIYQVPEFLWPSSASMYMEGNVARWVREYKRSQGLGNWAQFTQAVQEKFGAEEDSHAMRGLLQLTQRSSLEEYVHAFEEAKYAKTLHNLGLGETLFVSQFVKGLKGELQGHVLAQLPRTLDRAILLAQIQQEVVEMNQLGAISRGSLRAYPQQISVVALCPLINNRSLERFCRALLLPSLGDSSMTPYGLRQVYGERAPPVLCPIHQNMIDSRQVLFLVLSLDSRDGVCLIFFLA
jgi:hypothetical protein